jgi:hypothetical protein
MQGVRDHVGPRAMPSPPLWPTPLSQFNYNSTKSSNRLHPQAPVPASWQFLPQARPAYRPQAFRTGRLGLADVQLCLSLLELYESMALQTVYLFSESFIRIQRGELPRYGNIWFPMFIICWGRGVFRLTLLLFDRFPHVTCLMQSSH